MTSNQPPPDPSEDSSYPYTERQTVPLPEKAFRLGDGRISGYVALFLGIISFLAVLCYRYPSVLTTPELRAAYDPVLLQQILMVVMILSLIFALLTFCLGRRRRMGAVGVLFTVAAYALGGYQIATGPVPPSPLSFGLDWVLLAFIASAVLFIFLEKVFPKYRDQVILRPEWSLDLSYFIFNHLLITVLLLVGNYVVVTVFGWALSDAFAAWMQSLPLLVQTLILLVCADLVLYASHRAFHEVPWLWKFHAVHHSVEHMDWMAGSRNHVVQMFADRCLVMIPLYLLSTDKAALDLYVTFAAFQAVYVHANIGLPTGPLKYILCTPQYHHWHHSSEQPAIDTNYAVHLPLFDRLFGTYHMPARHWPAHYGTTRRLPRTFWGQFMYPFRKD